MSDKYEEKIQELEITVDQLQSTISQMKKTFIEQKLQLESEYNKKNTDIEWREKLLNQRLQNFENRKKNAAYYEALVKVIADNPSLQGEWIKFMTWIKLTCEPEEVKKLGG
jgi:hypothetical protein